MEVAAGNRPGREEAKAGPGPAGLVPKVEAVARLAGRRPRAAGQPKTSARSTTPWRSRALAIGLRDDSAPPVRLLYIEALARIDTPEAAKALAIASIYDAVEEVRLTCLDRLQTKPRPEVVAYYVGKLRDKKSTTR